MIDLQIDEPHPSRIDAQDVTILLFQRRASNDAALATGQAVANENRQRYQPTCTVFVLQRNPGGHFGDVGRGMEVVTVMEWYAQASGQPAADSRLAAAGHAHDDDETRVVLHLNL